MYSQPQRVESRPIDVKALAEELSKHLDLKVRVIGANSSSGNISVEDGFDSSESIAKAMISDRRLDGIVSNLGSASTNQRNQSTSEKTDLSSILKTLKESI